MPIVDSPGQVLWEWVPFVAALILLPLIHRLTWWILLRDRTLSHEKKLPRQIATIVVAVVGLIVLVVLMPSHEGGLITDSTKGDLLGLLGLALAALLTLSSTTLGSNAMAGLMLRMERSFRPGDFVRVEETFGRVTQRGLFHTEVQTEDRDIVTLPNLYLATKPVRVVLSSGTIISTELSLGYDVAHDEAELLLLEAAEKVGLEEPFVWITELRDHAVAYRVCGFTEDVKTLVSVRSKLRGSVLDTLHGAGVEIVSPSFMAQRPSPREEPMIPRPVSRRRKQSESAPEAIVFDKADAAEHHETLLERERSLEARLHELEQEMKSAQGEEAAARVSREIERVSHELADVDAEIKASKDRDSGEGRAT